MNDNATLLTSLRQYKPSWWDKICAWSFVAWAGNAQEAWSRTIFSDNLKRARRLRICGISAAQIDAWTFFHSDDSRTYDLMAEVLLASGKTEWKHNNSYHDYILHRVAAAGDAQMVALLLDLGADTSVRCGNDYTPLGCTVRGWGERVADWKWRYEVVKLLLRRGVNASALEGRHNASILSQAPVNLELFTLLADAGAPLQWTEPSNTHDGHPHCTQHALFLLADAAGFCEDPEQWLTWMDRYGQTPSLRNTQGRSLLLQWTADAHVRTKEDVDKTLRALRRHQYDMGAVDNTGKNIFHLLWERPNRCTSLMLDGLLELPEARNLLTVRDNEGSTPFDVLQAHIDGTSPVLYAQLDGWTEQLCAWKAQAENAMMHQHIDHDPDHAPQQFFGPEKQHKCRRKI